MNKNKQKSRIKKVLCLVSVCVLMVATAIPAFAQDSSPEPKTPEKPLVADTEAVPQPEKAGEPTEKAEEKPLGEEGPQSNPSEASSAVERAAKPVEPASESTPAKPPTKKYPPTGDSQNPGLYGVLLLAATAVLILLRVRKNIKVK